MTHFNRKYHSWTVGASVSATPDVEVSIDGTVTIPTLNVTTLTPDTLDLSGNASAFTVALVSASVSNPVDITTQRMLRISNGTENFYILAVTSASVRF